MKILICRNKHCRHNGSENLIKKLQLAAQEKNVEVLHSSCFDLCEEGPNILMFPSLKMYGRIEERDIPKVLENHIEHLRIDDSLLYTDDLNLEYYENTMHHRTVKLFRYHLEKYTDMSPQNLIVIIREFKLKYGITGMRFTFPVKVSLLGTVKGPDLPKVIHFLGKEKTLALMNEFLKSVSSR